MKINPFLKKRNIFQKIKWLFLTKRQKNGKFNEFIFPMVNAVMPNLLTNDIARVQPMTQPSKLHNAWKMVVDHTIYFDRSLKLKTRVFGGVEYRCAKIGRIYPVKEYYLDSNNKKCLDAYHEIMDKLQESKGTLYWYNDLGIMCGRAGYIIVKDDKIIYTKIIKMA